MTRVAKKSHKISTCLLCGYHMNCDNRVRVSFQWEFPDVQRYGHKKVDFVNSKSVSKYVCRNCATKISHQIGLPKPKEIIDLERVI